MEINPINVAVVGCGVISDIYLQLLQNKFTITQVVACNDRNPEKMRATAAKYHIKAMSYASILADPAIDLIVNLTTPKAHYEIIKQALTHGKHVFSEKMMAVELAEGQELCSLAQAHNLRLGVAPDTFLGGGIQTARYIVDHSLIGDPLSVVVSLNRNFRVYADIFPHMNQRGGTLPFDTGCYYLTALASILGPAKQVSAFGRRYQPTRVGQRTDKPWFGEETTVAADNILTAIVAYENGVLATVHFNSENILNEDPQMTLFGSAGTLKMGDPNNFGSPNYLVKQRNEPVKFPFTHGFLENSRGIGVADMAWAIRQNRPHRASMEMAYHVFELIHGMYRSADTGTIYHLQSTFTRPQPLPSGYLDNGFWGPTEESALAVEKGRLNNGD
ncbi:Gfo/Idh/MocA family oxidoreductase [Levilactobacillus brevis]|nr:Gfo/Idh/MocA family oxidoreductase [Levilactobacillus brevis]